MVTFRTLHPHETVIQAPATNPEASERFMRQAQKQIKTRYQLYEQLAHLAVMHAETEAEKTN